MENQLASREILWNIPASYKIAMYIMLALSLAIFIKGFYAKYRYITENKSLGSLLPESLNWKDFFKTLFLQGKVTRKPAVGIFHALLYYGFLILWIATDLVAIHYDTPFKVFQGTTYKVISFLADFAGLAILIGLGLAYYRRYIQKPDYLKSTKPQREKMMYFMLINLVVLGFVLEGLRILGTGMPIGEKSWAPLGWGLALLFKTLPFSNATLASFYRGIWFVHMVSTMIFVIMLAYSKFSHIILLPFAALITPRKRGAVLEPMDFENEEAESFGLAALHELTPKQRYDTLSCVECGRCTQVCPANQAEKPLDPKLIITKLRDFKQTQPKDDQLWKEGNQLYSANELDSCTTCGACMEECPAHIEHVPVIMELKRYKALTRGELPPAAADTVNKIRNNGNPWGISQDERFSWAQGLNVPIAKEGVAIDYLYYVGCAGSYDAANQKVVRDTLTLLKKAQVSFAVIGKTEKCNGDPVRRFGDEYSFTEIAIENITALNKYSFQKIVTHCPHCLHTIGKEYNKFEQGRFEVIHHTELLAELIKLKKLIPKKSLEEKLTFHDPCYLGRHHGEYNAPRFILNSIPGTTISEMKENKEKSLCCGMGGGNMWYEINEGEELAQKRLEQVTETPAEKLATGCSFCLINFNSSKGKSEQTEKVEVEDVASILAQSILDT